MDMMLESKIAPLHIFDQVISVCTKNMLFCAADHLCHYFLETLVSFAQQSFLEFLAIIFAKK
jgi:hypothetical protein